MHSGQSFLSRSRAPLRDDLFGQPSSIDRAAWKRLPHAMRSEGALLLQERGLTVSEIANRLDEREGAVKELLAGKGVDPFRRGGEEVEKKWKAE